MPKQNIYDNDVFFTELYPRFEFVEESQYVWKKEKESFFCFLSWTTRLVEK